VEVLADPVQGLQATQPAFAVLDVRLDKIARLADALVAVVALGKFCSDEFRGRALHDFLVKADLKLVE
jgi:hypothetical protein